MVGRSPLAIRMKSYEAATGTALPTKSWAVLRLDGKAFHSYSRNLDKPFDYKFMEDMTSLMSFLCRHVGGAVFGYTQSDEISIILHDLSSPQHQHWFGGKVQKIVSVAASYAGANWSVIRGDVENFGVFDARVFALPSMAEVKNYLLWRQQDSEKNAIFMAASEFYSHKELLGKSGKEKILMLADVGKSWQLDYSDRAKLGAISSKVAALEEVTYTRKDTEEEETTLALRQFWVSRSAILFQQNFSSPIFRFLNPEEQPCKPSEFLSLEPTLV
jgi:tRNA(His) guanylyltransferase